MYTHLSIYMHTCTYTHVGEPQLRQQLVDVFSLVDALWGQEIENEDKNKNGNGGGLYVGRAYAEQAYRRKRLSTWLKSVNKRKEPRINKDTIEVVNLIRIMIECVIYMYIHVPGF